MKAWFLPFSLLAIFTALAGCLTTPVAKSGGSGAGTVVNSNPSAIIAAATSVFAEYGYTLGPVDYPNSVSFDKPAGTFGKLMYGSYGVTTTVRVKLSMIPLPGTNANYRLSTQVSRVSDAGEAGFEDSQRMLGLWSAEFKPLVRQIITRASNAGAL